MPPPSGQDLRQAGDANFGAMDRLEKLERRNRRQKMYWAFILAVLGVILAFQAYVFLRPLPSGLAGETLMVRDASGKVRASLDTNGGKVGLELWDREGHRRAALGLGSQGAPHLAFYDREQRVRAELNLGPDGEPKFTLRDKGSLQGKTEANDFSDSSHRPQGRCWRGSESDTAASPPAGQAEAVSPKAGGRGGSRGRGLQDLQQVPLSHLQVGQGDKTLELDKIQISGGSASPPLYPVPYLQTAAALPVINFSPSDSGLAEKTAGIPKLRRIKDNSRQDEVMGQARMKETSTSLRLILSESPPPRLVREGARCVPNSPKNGEDLIPYSPKELKYLWILWDEAQRYQQPGLRYRNIYAGAMGVILTGWLVYGLGLSVSAPVGGILVLAGALTGAWYFLKSLLH